MNEPKLHDHTDPLEVNSAGEKVAYWITTCRTPDGRRGCFREFRVYSEREAKGIFLCAECRGT